MRPGAVMQFTIESDEGIPIRGDLHIGERPRALVVIVHGFKGFKDWGFFPWLAGELAGHRLVVCRFNMSRNGIGDDPETFGRLDLFADDTYSIELADLRAVVRYAQERFPSLPTFLVGHSRGGGVALLGAEEVPRLEGVVALSPIARVDRWDEETIREWRRKGTLDVVNQRTQQVMRMSPAVLDDFERNAERLDILSAVTRLQVPLLVVHGDRDESVPSDEGRLIVSRAGDASLAIIGNASHTFNAIHPLIHVPVELSLAAELTAHFVTSYAGTESVRRFRNGENVASG
ncbi:MAG TPA: alpha/beta fold hydrolase [Thermoanaerobaculia bacterium]